LPGAGVALEGEAAALLDALREGDPPVVALVRDDRVVLDVRCVTDTAVLARAVAEAAGRATAQKGDTLEGATQGGPEPGHLADRMADPLDTEV
jgi:hypothetical protein